MYRCTCWAWWADLWGRSSWPEYLSSSSFSHLWSGHSPRYRPTPLSDIDYALNPLRFRPCAKPLLWYPLCAKPLSAIRHELYFFSLLIMHQNPLRYWLYTKPLSANSYALSPSPLSVMHKTPLRYQLCTKPLSAISYGLNPSTLLILCLTVSRPSTMS